MPKKSPANPKQFTKDKIIGALGIIIILLVGGYFAIYRPLAIKHDKDRFLSAQASIEDLFTQIEAKIGKPDQVKRDQSCAYASREFQRGPRSCGIDLEATYNNKGVPSANNILSQASSMNSNSLRMGPGSDQSHRFVTLNDNARQAFYQTINSYSGLSCAVSYSYFEQSEVLTIGLGCSGNAKAEHFPVKR